MSINHTHQGNRLTVMTCTLLCTSDICKDNGKLYRESVSYHNYIVYHKVAVSVPIPLGNAINSYSYTHMYLCDIHMCMKYYHTKNYIFNLVTNIVFYFCQYIHIYRCDFHINIIYCGTVTNTFKFYLATYMLN